MLSRCLIISALVIATGLNVTACGGKPETLTSEFVFAMTSDPVTLDPGRMTGVLEGRIAFNVFEGLFMPGDGDAPVQKGAAESYEISEDGRTWTIRVRKDARWSNGDPVTADDFAFAWRRAVTPRFAADYAYFLDDIEGVRAYRTGELSDWEQVGIKVVDSHTLQVRLAAPVPLQEKLCFFTFFPVHRESLVEKWNDDGTWTEADGYWLDARRIVSNGPYRLSELRSQQQVVLTRNPHWRDADRVAIETVRIRIMPDPTAVLHSFQRGEVDAVFGSIPTPRYRALRNRPEMQRYPGFGTYYYAVNTTAHEALADKRVRHALSLAINRDDLVNRRLAGRHSVANAFVAPLPGYVSSTELPYDPDRARELLAEAGYPHGEGLPPFELLINEEDDDHRLIAEVLQDQWRELLGVRVELENQEWGNYLERRRRMNYQIARAGWIGDYMEPRTFLNMFIKDGGHNQTGWHSDEYDELLQRALHTHDAEERNALYAQAERLLLDELPIIPVFHYGNAVLLSPRVEGFKPNPREIYQFRFWSLR